jgi:chemotaxis protein CheX
MPDMISEEQLRGIVWQVWTAYLDSEPGVRTAPEPGPDADPAEVTASVGISGACNGLTVMRCSRSSAAMIAGAMLDIEPATAHVDDLTDAVGELVNILAGNVKSLLPQPSHLSLPQVVVGTATVVWPGTAVVEAVEITWREQPVLLSLLHGEPKPL